MSRSILVESSRKLPVGTSVKPPCPELLHPPASTIARQARRAMQRVEMARLGEFMRDSSDLPDLDGPSAWALLSTWLYRPLVEKGTPAGKKIHEMRGNWRIARRESITGAIAGAHSRRIADTIIDCAGKPLSAAQAVARKEHSESPTQEEACRLVGQHWQRPHADDRRGDRPGHVEIDRPVGEELVDLQQQTDWVAGPDGQSG